MRKILLLALSLGVYVILGGFDISTPSVFAAECIPASSAKTDCNPTSPKDKTSYMCMPEGDEDACKGMGGTLEKDLADYPGCGGGQGCCVAPICEDEQAAQGNQPIPQTGSTEKWVYQTPGGLRLVGCTKTGNCELVDIVQQGIYVADFLIGLSGALFLIAFIWGGAMYLLSFGRQNWVTKGRDAMVKSAIGIVFIIMAWTIVTFVAESLGYKGL